MVKGLECLANSLERKGSNRSRKTSAALVDGTSNKGLPPLVLMISAIRNKRRVVFPEFACPTSNFIVISQFPKSFNSRRLFLLFKRTRYLWQFHIVKDGSTIILLLICLSLKA